VIKLLRWFKLGELLSMLENLDQNIQFFFNTYKHLVNEKGVRFPEATKDETPVVTPDGKHEKHKQTGGERLRQSLKKNNTIPNNIQTLINDIKDNVTLLEEMLKTDKRDETVIQQIVTALKEKQANINTFINQNIENERITSILLSTFEDIERVLSSVNGTTEHDDEESAKDESEGSNDSLTNTQTGDFSKTDDTFFRMYIEPKMDNNNHYLVQDIVKSNNPFLETKPNPGVVTTQPYGNEFLGFNFLNNTNPPPVSTKPPPQNITFSFQNQTDTTTTTFNSQNDFFNSKPENNQTKTNNNNNYMNNSTPNPEETPHHQPYVDLFGTNTRQNNNQNDPFKDLFSMFKGQMEGTQGTTTTTGGSNPFSTINPQQTTNTNTKNTNPFL